MTTIITALETALNTMTAKVAEYEARMMEIEDNELYRNSDKIEMNGTDEEFEALEKLIAEHSKLATYTEELNRSIRRQEEALYPLYSLDAE